MTEYACTIVVRVLADSPAEASAKLARQVPVSFALHAIEPVPQQPDQAAAAADGLSVDRGEGPG